MANKRNDPREAEGENPMGPDATPPGVSKATDDIHFEGLGNLSEFPDSVSPRDAEGAGAHVVVISDILTGADGEVYKKGTIHRLSKLITGYDDAEKQDLVKSQVKRLVTLRAIRKATPEEVEQGYAVVTADSESQAASDERAKRLAVEDENARLRRQLAELRGEPVGQEPTAPGTKDDPFSEE